MGINQNTFQYKVINFEVAYPADLPSRDVRGGDPDPEPAGGGAGGRGEVSCDWLTLQKVASELHPKVRNHGEGPY